MNSNDTLGAVVRGLLMQLPTMLVLLVACGVVVMRWRSLRGGALPALLGFGLSLATQVVFLVVWQVVARSFRDRTAASVESVYTVLGMLNSLLHAGAFGLVLLGVVLGRQPATEPLRAVPVSVPPPTPAPPTGA